MGNARLDEAQVVIKIAERNSNKLRYVEDATLMNGREGELKNPLRVKEKCEETGLKLNIKKKQKQKKNLRL